METKLIKNETVAEGTMRFYFEKPEGFSFTAGQSIDLFLVNPPETDAKGDKRAFTLACSPGDAYLAITTRMRDSAFKRTLKAMPAGTPLTVEGPFGDLILQENSERPVVFLAGGIGITPFYAMAKDAAERKLPHTITLFYSNRRPEDAAFLQELMELQKQNEHFTLVATMTQMEKSAETWDGEEGFIDESMLAKYIAAADKPIYYLAGPAGMVAAMRTMLNKMGVSNDNILTEEFSGY